MARVNDYNFLMDSFNRDQAVCCFNASAKSDWDKPVKDILSYSSVTDEIDTLKKKINEIDETIRKVLKESCELKQTIIKHQQDKYLTLNMEWEPV